MARGGKKLRKQCHTTSQNKRLTSQPPGNGRWAFGGIVEYAGAIVSGIRKIVAKIRYPQFSYSSKAKVGLGEYCHANGIHASNKSEKISLIEQLVKDLTFSREECYSLTLLLESQVTDWPMGVQKIPTTIPGKWADNEEWARFRKDIIEAKEWYIEQNMVIKALNDELILPGTEHKGSAKLRDQTVEVISFEEYPKQEISALKEQLENAFEEQLKRITEKVESMRRETIHRLEQQLAAEQAGRLAAEAEAKASQMKSND